MKKTVVLSAFIVILVTVMAAAMIAKSKYPEEIFIPTEDMRGSMQPQEGGGWYADEYTSQKGFVLYGPYMEVKKGSYTIEVEYECDRDNYVDVNANSYTKYLMGGDVTLSRLSTRKAFTIRVQENLDNLEIRIHYEGKGFIRVNSIHMYRNSKNLTKGACILVVCMLLLILCCCKAEALWANREAVLWVLLIAFFSTAPMMARGFCLGHDGKFHMLRIEGIAQELLNGRFPVRMQSIWMEGYGYPVSLYYGDLLLYIPALLRIIGFSVSEAYKIYVFLVNLGTVVLAQLCFGQVVKDRKAAGIAAAAYALAPYRFNNMYVRMAVGEYTAQMALPVILLAVYRIYTAAQDAPERERGKTALLLALGMTGLVQTHIISVAMVCITLVIFALVMYKKTFRKKTIFTYIKAALMSVGLNLFFIVPFLDYYLHVPVQVTGGEEGILKTMEHNGAYIGQYFMQYQEMAGAAGENVGDRMGLTPGVVLMLALFAGVYVCVNGKDRMCRLLSGMSVLVLFMASNIFPWNDVVNHVPFMGWAAQIQFPYRFLSIALAVLALLLCRLLSMAAQGQRALLYPAAALAVLVLSFQLCTSVMQDRPYSMIYDIGQIDSFSLVNGEYVREGTDVKLLDGQVHSNGVISLEGYRKEGTFMEFQCEAGETGNAWVELPVLNYRGYVAADQSGNRLEIEDGSNNVVRVLLWPGYSGRVTVDFISPWYYRAAEFCTLLSVVLIIAKIV